MKVKELIEKLREFDENAQVMIKTWDSDFCEYDYDDISFEYYEYKTLVESKDGEIYIPSDLSKGEKTRIVGIRRR